MNISLYCVHLNVSSSENDNKCSVMQEIGKADYYPVITKGDNIYIVIIVLFLSSKPLYQFKFIIKRMIE